MKKVVYRKPSDAVLFDFDKFYKSINRYANVPADIIKEALQEVEQYDTVHNSRLINIAGRLIYQYSNEDNAMEYLEKHSDTATQGFERLRRITGYLVGTLDRWNDGKKAEEKERVKHTIAYKDYLEKEKRAFLNEQQQEYYQGRI